MLRKLLAVPFTAVLITFGSAAQAQIWTWSFTDMGVDYSLSFDSLAASSGGNSVGTYTLRLNTEGYNQQPQASAYLDSVDIKAWGGTDISFSLLSAPGGASRWTPTEGPISGGSAVDAGCGGQSAGFACVEALQKGMFNVNPNSNPSTLYTFRFAVTADTDNFNTAFFGSHVGAGYSDRYGNGSSFGITSVTAPIPEPETYAMLLAGLGLMGFVARRRQRNLAAN
jgi:hypothetical protein